MSLSNQLRTPLLGAVLMVITAVLLYLAFERHLAGAWFAFGAHPEILRALEEGLEDQKALAEQMPQERDVYRQRFDRRQQLLQHLQILAHSREDIVIRYRQLLLLAFAATVLSVTALSVARGRQQARRLNRLGAALEDLADGRTDIVLGERRSDVIGHIATMVERTSRVMARDRRRLAALKNLSAWQEAARRHAHEMRTPLTGARLELSRLSSLLEGEALQHPEDVQQATRSATQELERLGRFTQEFTSFARLPRPQLKPWNLDALLAEYVGTFESAWPKLNLKMAKPEVLDDPEDSNPHDGWQVQIDRDMLRQVLVNLCDNSALALAERPSGEVIFQLRGGSGGEIFLDVADDGPGVDPAIRHRLFEPYTTTRSIGEGMGLGLAICKKILLDHDGDLELFESSPQGTTFRLTLQRPQHLADQQHLTAPHTTDQQHPADRQPSNISADAIAGRGHRLPPQDLPEES